MAEQTPRPDTEGDDTGAGAGSAPAAGMPRWVKALGLAALVLVVLFAVLHLTFGGLRDHAP